MKKIELLSPAGNYEKLKTALAYGADAFYGSVNEFSMRATVKKGFTLETLAEGIELAHKFGKKFFVTLNIIPLNFHLEALKKLAKKLLALNPDAFIVSDPGVIEILKEINPQVEIHLSTQANATSSKSVIFWHKQGVSRVVLARELSYKDITDINLEAKVPTEIFVHGSMCMAYSGRCLLSHYIERGRHANLGLCLHPCRWKYRMQADVSEKNFEKADFSLEEDEYGTYVMNSKDLCLLTEIPKIIESGVCSMKIEGRTKSPYYVGSIVRLYRQALNDYEESPDLYKKNIPKYLEELKTVSSRGYWKGFFVEENEAGQEYTFSNTSEMEERFSGQVIVGNAINPLMEDKEEILLKNRIRLIVHNKIIVGDVLEALLPGKLEPVKIEVKKIEALFKNNLVEINTADTSKYNLIEIETTEKIPSNTLIRKKYNIS